jgi:uncharacterized protein YndB with AHSA1/START domain
MDKIIHLSLHLPIDAGYAYRLFTDNTLLESWLTETAEVEPVVGGKYELFWDLAHREDDSTIGCRITALAPDQLIAFEWRSPKQFKSFANSADPLTHVVVTLIPEGEGTRVHLVHSGWRSAPEWEEARAWQERGWNVAFEALQKAAAGD